MNAIRFGRGREVQFFLKRDILSRWDLRSAEQFLNRFRNDAVAMATFRREVAGKEPVLSTGKLSDVQVIQNLARMLVSGEFLVVPPDRLRQKDTLELPVAPAAPAAKKTSAPAEAQEDEPTFHQEHDGVAQAGVLIAAARGGFAFCEECAKSAAEQAISKPVAKPAAAPAARRTTAPLAVAPPAAPGPAAKPQTAAPAAGQPVGPPAAKQTTNPPAAPAAAGTLIAKPEAAAPPPKETAGQLAVEKETYWIEIELVGEDGRPLPGEDYVVELPDGKQVTGVLDANGLARISDLLVGGTCKVSFPKLDREAWEMVGTEAKGSSKR